MGVTYWLYDLQTFSLIPWVAFHFLDGVLQIAEVFSLYEGHFINLGLTHSVLHSAS